MRLTPEADDALFLPKNCVLKLAQLLPLGRLARIAQSIKRADRMAAYLEATELAGFSDTDAGKLFPKPRGTPKGIDLTPLSPEKATRSFLRRFDVLFGRNGPAR